MNLVRFRRTWILPLFFLALNVCSQSALGKETCDWNQCHGATYKSGYRGVMPPEADVWNHQSYEVLGRKDGLRAWMVRYDDHLYRGGELESADGARSLAELGIKTVFAITSVDKERQWLESRGIEIVDLSFAKNDRLSEQRIRKIAEQISARPGPVYVHCVGGTQRGGVVGVIYRLSQGWDVDQSLLEFAFLGGSLKGNSETLKSVLQSLAAEEVVKTGS